MTAEALPFLIRPACACDLTPILALEGTWLEPERRFPAAVLEYMSSLRSCRTFVADAGGMLGFVICYKPAGPVGEIMMLDVAPDRRELGIGTSLMHRAEQWLAGLGAQTVFLEVDGENGRATRLYHELGYHPIEEFVEDGRTRILMRKWLAPWCALPNRIEPPAQGIGR